MRADVEVEHTLSDEGARKAVDAVLARARELGTTAAVAVVDRGGNAIALFRLDGTFAASATVSLGKARTAALFAKPTRFFEELIRGGRTPMIALPDFTPLQGGVPIEIDGEVVGGLGVSGAASAAQDEELALVGVAALSPRRRADASPAASESPVAWLPEVLHFPRESIDAGFAKGAPLVELAGFKIHTSRRDAPGKAEIHERDVDIFYVLDGTATIVTGGELVDPVASGDGERRGRSIRGGKAMRLAKGDVMVIPSGTPHWFRDVDGPMTYYAVKYTVGAR